MIIEPAADDWAWLDSIAGKLDEDFVQAVDEQLEPQERPALEELFGDVLSARSPRSSYPRLTLVSAAPGLTDPRLVNREIRTLRNCLGLMYSDVVWRRGSLDIGLLLIGR
jgi:hypothetical protein